MGFWEIFAICVVVCAVFIYCARHLGNKMENMRTELHSLSNSFAIVAKETQENTQNIRENVSDTMRVNKKLYWLVGIARRMNTSVVMQAKRVNVIDGNNNNHYTDFPLVEDKEFDKFSDLT